MNTTYVKPRVTALLLLFVTIFSCRRNPIDPGGPGTIDLSQVLMTDFQLVETTYSAITVKHPVITNGVQTAMGEIRVTIPAGTTFQLTPKASNFTNPEFTVSPQLGQPQNFLNRTIIYSIISNKDASKLVRYAVTITEAQAPPVQASLTSFRFEKAKNPSLPADVEATRIVEGVATLGKVIVFVPEGTSFASLTPTIGFQGTGLFYSQDAASSPDNATTVYPAAGLAIDFTWPKVFYAVVKSGTEVKTYEVIVDVKAPIRFDNAAVTTPNVQAGVVHTVQATTFRNVGNHPISLIAVDQSNPLPAGTSAVRGMGFIPNGGLKAGESATVTATISAQTWPPGTYAITSTFRPKLFNHPEADGLLENTSLRITSTIVQ